MCLSARTSMGRATTWGCLWWGRSGKSGWEWVGVGLQDYRSQGFDPRSESVSPLAPQQWTIVASAQEMDYIQTKRRNGRYAKAKAAAGSSGDQAPQWQMVFFKILVEDLLTVILLSLSAMRLSMMVPIHVTVLNMKLMFLRGHCYDSVAFEDGCAPELLPEFNVGMSKGIEQDKSHVPKGLENADVPQFDHQLDVVLSASSSPKKEMMRPTPFPSWVEQFVRQVSGAKTGFSYFVLQSISASRSGRTDSTATALFPIPYPHDDVFWSGPDHLGKKYRHVRALRKMLHLAVMALNFEHFRSPMSILPVLYTGCLWKSFQSDARFNEFGALEAVGLNPGPRLYASSVSSRQRGCRAEWHWWAEALQAFGCLKDRPAWARKLGLHWLPVRLALHALHWASCQYFSSDTACW